MPQLDIYSFLSQFFWFTIGFWALYVVSFKYFLIPTAMSLKIREYLSYEKDGGSILSDDKSLFTGNRASSADKLLTVYSSFIENIHTKSYSNLIKSLDSTDSKIRSSLLKQTNMKALRYALNKNSFDFMLKSGFPIAVAKKPTSSKSTRKRSKK